MDDYSRKNRIREIYDEQINMEENPQSLRQLLGGRRVFKRPHPTEEIVCVEGGARKRVVRRRRVTRRSGSKAAPRRRVAKRKVGAKRGTSKWIMHVKKYAKSHGISYGDAMKKARSSYKGGTSAGVLVGGRRKRRVKRAGVLVGGKQKKLVALIKKLM